MDTPPQILIVSGACCSPNLVRLDLTLEKNLQQALSEIGVNVGVRKVSLSVVLNGGGDLTPEQHTQVTALFQGYGARFCPALIVGDQVRFAGTPPSVDQLKDALRGMVALDSE